MTPRPRRRCTTCGHHTNGRHGICKPCLTDIPLRGGRWVLGPRGVQVWQPTRTTSKETR